MWSTFALMLVNLPFGVLTFAIVVTGVSTAGGLIVTLVGLPLLAMTVAFGRVIGVVGRALARTMAGTAVTGPAPEPPATGVWPRIRRGLTDTGGWRGLLFGALMLPWGIATFVVAFVIFTVGLWSTALPTWGWAVDLDGGLHGMGKAVYLAGSFVVGIGALLSFPWVVLGLGRAHGAIVRAVLGSSTRQELEARVDQLRVSRDASVDAAAIELRRIERDLHDGAQQRLVGLAMDLGLARERLVNGADPARALELVERAHDQSKRAVAELRDLVRGIHPVVLMDRGLDAALSALASRSPVPVDVDVVLPAGVRPPASVEATAYFVVAETLTNVAKHSRASQASVRVVRLGDRLVVEVRDDGRGGAVVAPAGGLAGLHDRVLAAEGTMTLRSPEGGPTTIHVELPCAS